jgi:hypothetical protein
MREQISELLDGASRALLSARQLERNVVVRAEAGQLHVSVVCLFPRVELLPNEENGFPQISTGARGAATLYLDYRSGNFDDAGIEVHGTAGRKVVRPSLAVHHLFSNDLLRAAEDVLGPDLHAVHDYGEFGFHADRRELDTFPRG